MTKKRVMVVKYGFVVVDADTDSEAVELTNKMTDRDFDWSDFGDAHVVEDVDLE